MKKPRAKITSLLLAFTLLLSAAGPAPEEGMDNALISNNQYKSTYCNNPLSSEVFCADPTAVEYNGRLYVFGTNDHQQHDEKGPDEDNTYEKIKSLVIFSTEDMENWIYHGEINVGEIAPWIINSWAPSITSRVEEDGLTHFYLYFSNNGTGVGVITATDPLGPWTDPLGEPLISANTEGLKGCPNPFDPGVVIDENGDGWLSFGGGRASGGSDYMPGSARIVKLGADMTSFASDFTEIPAPYFFEASELNYINGTYVYTYCSDWSDHTLKWDYDCEVPTGCSMIYMTTKTPLDSDSWEMKGECFKNPGISGFDYSNNHTHLHKYKDQYYILYHTLSLKRGMGISGGYRSLCVDKINVDETTVTIEKIGGTQKGISSDITMSPYVPHLGAELNNTADITFHTENMAVPIATSDCAGAWTSVKNVKFTDSAKTENEAVVADPVLTNIESITYNLTVTDLDKNTVITMHASDKSGVEVTGSVEVTGTGEYSVTCDFTNARQMQNLGYFRASDGALLTMKLENIVINDTYEILISSELTNTREWADGLKNIWGGFSDGDSVYLGETCEFKYNGSDSAIEFFVLPLAGGDSTNAPNTEEPLVFLADVKGSGRIEVRLDSRDGDLLTLMDFDSPDDYSTVSCKEVAEIGGTHDLYFIYSKEEMSIKSWQFAILSDYEQGLTSTEDSQPKDTDTVSDTLVSDNGSHTGWIAAILICLFVVAVGAFIIVKKKK